VTVGWLDVWLDIAAYGCISTVLVDAFFTAVPAVVKHTNEARAYYSPPMDRVAARAVLRRVARYAFAREGARLTVGLGLSLLRSRGERSQPPPGPRV
jgi:hypothetical protein